MSRGRARAASLLLLPPHPLMRRTEQNAETCRATSAPLADPKPPSPPPPLPQGGESPPPALRMGGPRPIDIEFKDIKYVVKDRATGRPLEILKGVSGKVRGDGMYRR